jgi:hypothetical protein
MNCLLSELDSLSSQIECLGKKGQALPTSEQESYRNTKKGEYSRLRTLFRIRRKELARLINSNKSIQTSESDISSQLSDTSNNSLPNKSTSDSPSDNGNIHSNEDGENLFTKIGGMVKQIFDNKPIITNCQSSYLSSESGEYNTPSTFSSDISESNASDNIIIKLENIRKRIALNMNDENTENLNMVRDMMKNVGKLYHEKNDIMSYLDKIENELNKLERLN